MFPTVIVWIFYFYLQFCQFFFCFFVFFVSFCFIYFRVLLLHVCTFIILISSRLIDLFIILKCADFALVTVVVWKSILYDIYIVTPAILQLRSEWYFFFYPFTFNLLVSGLKYISCRQHRVGYFCFSASQSLLLIRL